MFTVMVILMCFVAVLLIAAVLLQPGKGDMMSGMAGISGAMSGMFGTRKTVDTLQKITIGLALFILAGSIITNKFFVGKGEQIAKPVTEGAAVPMTPTMPSVPTK